MAETRAKSGSTNQQIGIVVAVILHIVVIGLLSVQWTAGERRFDNPPMEVDLIAEVAPQSTAPILSDTPPAARLGEEDAFDTLPPEIVPATPLPEPVARPGVTKKPPPVTKRAPPRPPSKMPPKSRTTRPTGNLAGVADGLARDSQTKTPTKGAPAAATAAEVRRSVQSAVDREIRPYWQRNAPLGYEVELLRVTLEIRLRPDGSVVDIKQVGALGGKTESNAPQQQRFVEQARKSVLQAAPFDISVEGFDGVIVINQPFSATRR